MAVAESVYGHEVIAVCQDCGHLIEPQDVTAPWGDRYQITLCLRDECLADRMLADRTAQTRERLSMRQQWLPVVNDPSVMLRITGC